MNERHRQSKQRIEGQTATDIRPRFTDGTGREIPPTQDNSKLTDEERGVLGKYWKLSAQHSENHYPNPDNHSTIGYGPESYRELTRAAAQARAVLVAAKKR